MKLVRYVLGEIKAPQHRKKAIDNKYSTVMIYDLLSNYMYLISCQNLSTEICTFCDVYSSTTRTGPVGVKLTNQKFT